MLGMPVRARPPYHSSLSLGHRVRIRRKLSRALVERVCDDARRHHRKRRQEICAFQRLCRARVEGSYGCGSGPCRPILPTLPGRCAGSGRMRPAALTRTATSRRATTPAVAILVIAAGPGEGLGSQRIKGAPPELPTYNGAACRAYCIRRRTNVAGANAGRDASAAVGVTQTRWRVLSEDASRTVSRWPAAKKADPVWERVRVLVFFVQSALLVRGHDPGKPDELMEVCALTMFASRAERSATPREPYRWEHATRRPQVHWRTTSVLAWYQVSPPLPHFTPRFPVPRQRDVTDFAWFPSVTSTIAPCRKPVE